MKIIGGRRACGKTTELVKLSNENWTYIVCADKQRARFIVDTARSLNLDIPFPIAADELPIRNLNIQEVLVDDVESVLYQLIRKNVSVATSSYELVDLKGIKQQKESSPMRLDIMVDIETLGNKTDSTIFQIAAVAFDIESGKHIQTFEGISDISKDENIRVTGDTLKWWLNTNKELLSNLLNGGRGSSKDLLVSFNNWLISLISKYDVYFWGNGILFDNKMIQHQFESIGIDYPIFFRNDRDVRTIVELASHKTGLTERELRKKYYDTDTEAHNAAHDVANQIRLVTACYKELTN